MPVDRVRVDELRLRVPGLSADDGARLGRAVAAALARELPDSASATALGRIEIRLPATLSESLEATAGRIARAVLEHVR